MGGPKNLISMTSELWEVSLSPKTIYLYLWRHPDTQTHQETSSEDLWKYHFINLKVLEIVFVDLGKDRRRTIPTILLINS